MDIKRLHYFCTIVEQGQISRAAKVLHMSQPPLSQRLKELEEELGTQLIIREDGQWEVTKAGQILYEEVSGILSSLENLKLQIADMEAEIDGTVSIGISTTCESKLLSMLPGIHERLPAVQFRISVKDSSFLEVDVQDKKLDIAILLLPLESDDYEIYHLPPGGFSIVYSNKLTAPSKKKVSLDDLTDTPLMLSRRWYGGGSYEIMMRHWQKNGKTPEILLDSHNIHTLLRLVKVGMPAATIVPDTELTEEIRTNYQTRPLVCDFLDHYPVVITKKGRFMNQAVKAVIDYILSHSH